MTQGHPLLVAVIGAGVAGLVIARELHRETHRVVIFEKSDHIGGLWVYDPRVESDPLGQDTVHSSVYFSLRTNLPRPLMGFSDFSLEDREYGDPRMFPGHPEVLAFLNDFATRFGLVELVRFNSGVVRVERVEDRVDKWVVEWREGREKGRVKLEEKVFDAVMVCNGHCTVPRLADIPGIEKWPGTQIHSHNYRVPATYKDQVVIIVGNGASSYDISRDIAKVAKEVHISSRSPHAKFSKLDHYPNIWLHSAISMAKEDGSVEFKDNSSVQADVILHCTGYQYAYPFLKTNGIVNVDDNRVGPLYKHVFPPKLAPRLALVDLPQMNIIFCMIELQSKWIARVLSGKAKLPSEEEMMAEVKQYYQQMEKLNIPKHLTHFLHNFEEYMDFLASEAGTLPVEGWRKQIYRMCHLQRVENQTEGYRDDIDFIGSIQRTWITTIRTPQQEQPRCIS